MVRKKHLGLIKRGVPDDSRSNGGDSEGRPFSSDGNAMLLVQEEITIDGGNRPRYRYTFDPSTGTVVMFEDEQQQTDQENMHQDIGTVDDSSNSSLNGAQAQTLSRLKLSEYGDCIIEEVENTDDTSQAWDNLPRNTTSFSAFKHGVKLGHGNISRSRRRASNKAGSISKRRTLGASKLKKKSNIASSGLKWSQQMVVDLLNCIAIHEASFRQNSIIGKVWIKVTAAMEILGHSNVNRDECSKKWNNLYRSWRHMSKRPIEQRTNWKYYESVSRIVASLSNLDDDKIKEKNQRLNEFLARSFIEHTMIYQEAVRKAEEKFEAQMKVLNLERDEILCDIQKLLQR